MNTTPAPQALRADEAPPRAKLSSYPPPFAERMVGRTVRPLGDLFGLRNFGVNLVTWAPGAVSSLRHAHQRQDEFVYVLSGSPTLVTNAGETLLQPGMCTGFPAATLNAHMLRNYTETPCSFLVVGDRTPGDSAHYPDDDIVAVAAADGGWQFTRKNGEPCPR
jgi:uncharacterized cupin superfamily protein